ncbi:TenA family transcriptional regulator [Streptomyces sp. NPDC049577]|uniref:TenA family protein n=1 Tax=Streptomyces sp. NPDC049577 TaxID=3155153 RepID=UPI003430CC42
MTLRRRLRELAGPLLGQVLEHPFWAGLRDGTLPPEILWHFAEQDARHTVPAYARALARTAALADRDEDGALLAGAAQATFASLTRMHRELAALAGRYPGLAPAPGITPPTLAHTSFMTAVSATSFGAAVGGLLPMTWFHQQVCRDLRARATPGGRHAWWIDQYCPEDGFHGYVEAYLTLIDDFGRRAPDGQLAALTEAFLHGARYELDFCEAAWQSRGPAGE